MANEACEKMAMPQRETLTGMLEDCGRRMVTRADEINALSQELKYRQLSPKAEEAFREILQKAAWYDRGIGR